jgi:hypothetical protein
VGLLPPLNIISPLPIGTLVRSPASCDNTVSYDNNDVNNVNNVNNVNTVVSGGWNSVSSNGKGDNYGDGYDDDIDDDRNNNYSNNKNGTNGNYHNNNSSNSDFDPYPNPYISRQERKEEIILENESV